MHTHRTLITGAAVAALAVGMAACGDDDKDNSDGGGGGVVKPVAAIPALTGSSTKVALDKGFVKALGSLKVTPGTVGSASLKKTTLSFPITGGSVTYYKPGTVAPYVQGFIKHDGSGLSLAAGGTTVKLTDFIVDPGSSTLTGKVTVNGKLAFENADLFFLDGRTLKPLRTNKAGSKAVLAGTKVKLSAPAAKALNGVFKVKAFKKNFLIGVAKITVDVPK